MKAKLCRKVTMFNRQELVALFLVQGRVITCGNIKESFLSSCFIVGDSHTKIIALNTAIFNKNANLYF